MTDDPLEKLSRALMGLAFVFAVAFIVCAAYTFAVTL